MKKLLSIALVLALLLTLSVPAFASFNGRKEYVLLGDSIAEGYGIDNSYDACYGKIVADTNGYYYSNYARVATDSSELLERITEGSSYDYFYGVRRAIANADIISISIGANDYFDNDDVYNIAVKAFFGLNNKELDSIADNYYNNLCAIIDTIRELNPDVVILLQNVYTVWYGIARHLYTSCMGRINARIAKYDNEHPGEVYICDISPAMDGKPENLADDCVHPNAKGNVAIARVVLKQLYDLGLGTETEPVVNTEGIDYNYFEEYYDNKTTAKFLEILVKIVTGNAKNIKR